MIKNHFKIAWRNLSKDKVFSFIKIGGFSVGIAACLFIALFIRDEVSYDQHYVKGDRIYRVYNELVIDGNLEKWTSYPAPFAKALEEDFPEIEKAGRYLASELFGAGNKELRLEGQERNTYDEGFAYVDQELLEILEIPLLEGNPTNALSQPRSLVISKSKAEKYYPNGDAIGKSLILDNDVERPYKITGIMDDLPYKSHFDHDFLMTMEGRDFYPGEDTNWGPQNYPTYILVNDRTDIVALEKKILSVIADYMVPTAKEAGRLDKVEYLQKIKLKLQPVKDIHLRSKDIHDGLKHGDIRFIWLFATIAGFILILACINFINLSTAKGATRAKEVGLRKTVGAPKGTLVFQFLTESIMFSVISFVIGTLLAWLLLPMFNEIASKDIHIPWSLWWFPPTLVFSSLVIGLVAGLYLAFYLTSIKPVNVLKGNITVGGKSGHIRSGLVVFQFTTSVILIIATMIVYQQMHYILNKELGYEKEQVVILEGTHTLGKTIGNFKEQLLALPSIKSVSVSAYLPIEHTRRNGNNFTEEGKGSDEKTVTSQIWQVDQDYIGTLGMHLLNGRNFSLERASDSLEAVIINNTMAKKLGFSDPLGKRITNITNGMPRTIIGVVEDFHFESLKEDIEPLAMVMGYSPGMMSIKLEKGNIAGSLSAIEALWDKNVPNQAFRYTFLDQDFAQMHEDVNRMGNIFNSFALFAILVACLGLFALSTFMVEQRRKEISIRLVLGAPFKSIYSLLTITYIRLIIISVILAVPIASYLMERWLQDFAYPITIGWEVFAVSGGLAIVVALCTISYQSIAAALIAPLKSLRAE